MRNSWVEEFWRLLFVLLLAAIAGLLSGYFLLAVCLALLAYIARNLYNLQRLISWLSQPDRASVPVHFGIWGGIYAMVERMRSAHSQRERRLSDLLGQFQASAAALPDAAIALGPMGDIRWFNDAAQQMLGLRRPLDLGQPLVNLFRTPELVQYLRARDFSQALEVTAPGNRSRKLSIRVTHYGDGQLLLLAQDVTERYLSEQIRKDFVANVSHELRTPLTVISGFVENMQIDEASVPQQWRKPLDLIADQAERMRHIVEDLLLLARLESASKESPREPIDVSELCRGITREAQALAGERLQIEVQIASDFGLAGDPVQIRSAFTNLVVNAVNHTPAGGHISLKWRDEGSSSCFEVADDGEGIAPEHIPRLTERFYRVDVGRSRERGGTGLGLAIVKHVLQKHGAALEIESAIGEGSRFTCRFPAHRRISMSA